MVIIRPATIFVVVVDAMGTLWTMPYSDSYIGIQLISNAMLMVMTLIPLSFILGNFFFRVFLWVSLLIYMIGAISIGFEYVNVIYIEVIVIIIHFMWIFYIQPKNYNKIRNW
jgi:hypothetical protein